MNSFNAYGQTTKNFGGNTPVWLGTVKPIPVGAVLDITADEAEYPLLIKAGTPVRYRVLEGKAIFSQWNPSDDKPANGYLYNDIYVEVQPEGEDFFATGAIVMHHGEGLLIDRTDFAEYAEQLQAAIPGVLLVRG